MALSKAAIEASLKSPENLGPRAVAEYYAYLAALYSELWPQFVKSDVDRSVEEVKALTDHSSAAARKIADISEPGIKAQYLKAELKGLEELIRALKKMQSFLHDEALGII